MPQYPPVIAFLDERIKPLNLHTRIVFGCCLFGRDRWYAYCERESMVGMVHPRRRLEAIDNLLNDIGGYAVLAHAEMPSGLFPRHEIDSTDDIPRMSRTDNVWGQMALSTAFKAVSLLQRSGIGLGAIDLYYDRKDLTAAHRQELENLLRQALPDIAKEAAAEHPEVFTGDPSELHIDTIRSVSKPIRGQRPDPCQLGTYLAHYLCTQSERAINRGSVGRTVIWNHTAAACKMVSKFTEIRPT